jgi:hypothetical protein
MSWTSAQSQLQEIFLISLSLPSLYGHRGAIGHGQLGEKNVMDLRFVLQGWSTGSSILIVIEKTALSLPSLVGWGGVRGMSYL